MEEKGVNGGSGDSKTLEFHNMASMMNPLYPGTTRVKEPRLQSRPCETRSSRMSRIKTRKEEGTNENDVEKQMADSETALRPAHEFDQSDTKPCSRASTFTRSMPEAKVVNIQLSGFDHRLSHSHVFQ